jgi:N-acetylmuramoyl-L-alanine amidase
LKYLLFLLSSLVLVPSFIFINYNLKDPLVVVINCSLMTTSDEQLNKEIKEEIVSYIESEMQYQNVKMILESDEKISSNNYTPDVYLMLAINELSVGSSGFEILYPTESKITEKSIKFASQLVKKMAGSGLKYRRMNSSKNELLCSAPCTASLINLGYLKNGNDRKMLTSKRGQKKIAQAIAEAIEERNNIVF